MVLSRTSGSPLRTKAAAKGGDVVGHPEHVGEDDHGRGREGRLDALDDFHGADLASEAIVHDGGMDGIARRKLQGLAIDQRVYWDIAAALQLQVGSIIVDDEYFGFAVHGGGGSIPGVASNGSVKKNS